MRTEVDDATLCFHCGEPNPSGNRFKVSIKGKDRRMCCPGCTAVAQAIVDSGLTSYYDHRSENAIKANTLVPEQLTQLAHYDLAQVQAEFVKTNESINEVILSVEGITCAACAWLIEKQLRQLTGLQFINVNTTLHRIVVRWSPDKLKLSAILTEIQRIGYTAYPFQLNQQEAIYRLQSKSYLRRLGLAGIATMQIMMFAIALYTDFFSTMEAQFIHYFRWVSFILATPVLLYSAQPFYINAWRNLRNGTLGMDIPVSIALLSAYGASAYATIMATGDVYFEAISMFTFLLLLGRLLELRARRKASESSSNLLRLLPAMARLINNEKPTMVLANTLRIGQHILVKAGETIPIDGVILTGVSNVEESMLTGEHIPVLKYEKNHVFAGTVNLTSPLEIQVEKAYQQCLIAEIIHLQNTAQQHKPQIEVIADRVSRYFVGVLLVIALSTYICWYVIDPLQAFWITLSVLVATCPCALALATPTALTCATASLNKQGILIKKQHVLETINRIDHMLFDKTGTLTQGDFVLLNTTRFSHFDKQQCIDLATQLECVSEHPIAQAFHEQQKQRMPVFDISNVPGQGLQGIYQNKQLKLGNAQFCGISNVLKSRDLVIYLTLENELIACFELGDTLRESAQTISRYCRKNKIETTLLTGDISTKSEQVATQLQFTNIIKGVTPEGKLTHLRALQVSQHVLMVGDGINDAPVLSGANVSIALTSGTDIAKNSADVILLGDDLNKIATLRKIAQKTTTIIKQNLGWAIGYNVMIVPLAICGYVPPYIAVLGMSFSSLMVISNSLRLLK